ncbi:N-6 DNA methylase, partial [Chromobacterium amazonense]
FIKTLGGHGGESAYARHMKDARFTIPTPALLAKVVDMIDDVPMDDRDTKGDLYEYMLGKIASAGQNGQFRTPRHIIKLMVDMMAPTPEDTICDPACGTAGFLVAAAEYLRDHHGVAIYKDRKSAKRFNADTFHGFDEPNSTPSGTMTAARPPGFSKRRNRARNSSSVFLVLTICNRSLAVLS